MTPSDDPAPDRGPPPGPATAGVPGVPEDARTPAVASGSAPPPATADEATTPAADEETTPAAAAWLVDSLDRMLAVPRDDPRRGAAALLAVVVAALGAGGASFWHSGNVHIRLRRLATAGDCDEHDARHRELADIDLDGPASIGRYLVVPLAGLHPAAAAAARIIVDRGGDGRAHPFEHLLVPRLLTAAPVLAEATALHSQAATATRQARRDALTGIPNRLHLHEQLGPLLEAANGPQTERFAVLLVGLDHFKDVNDALGHATGDRLLQAVGTRLAGALRLGDFAVRLGSDEFAVVMHRVSERVEIAQLARRITDEVDKVRALLELPMLVTTSIGIAVAPDDATTASDLLRCADTALQEAKGAGRATFRFASTVRRRVVPNRLAIVSQLREALDDGHLRLAWQPQVRLSDGRVAGFEALLRVDHPVLGTVPPETLVALVESTRMIEVITEHGLMSACRQGLEWRRDGVFSGRLAVNLPSSMIEHPLLARWVGDALSATGFPPGSLLLEVTERAVVGNFPLAERTLRQLRETGVLVGIDDFGVGYSALAYLYRMPVDELKLDRSFIEPLPEDADCGRIVHGVVGIAHDLGIAVVAEGVETPEQEAWLRTSGCDLAQGYLFSHPLRAETVRRYLTQRRPAVSGSLDPDMLV